MLQRTENVKHICLKTVTNVTSHDFTVELMPKRRF